MKKNKVLLAVSVFLMAIFSLASFPSPKERLMNQPGTFVKLTNKAGTSGGSGFAVRAPSGKIYTMTNAHVCDGVKDAEDYVYGHDSMQDDRIIKLKVLEVSDFTDLCLLEAMPQAQPLEVSKRDIVRNDKIFILGFPALEPLTFAEGLKIADLHTDVLLAEVELKDCILPKHKIATIKASMFGVPLEFVVCTLSIDATITSIKIYPGNSGSAVMDESGNLVGVMFASGRTNSGSIIKLGDVTKFLSVY